ncbi:MAG TPA: hypothetical protein VFZ40_21480 [Pyrinomonadaceae bacterium]
MKSFIVAALIAISLAGCGSKGSTATNAGASRLSEDQKHRLYSAALAASESPLDNDTFKRVCREIGIFDAQGRPTDQYMAFVSRHVDWWARSETEQFRREINSKERARDYLKRHLSQ